MIFNDTRNDIEYAKKHGCYYLFIWGGRGHGKTYPTLRYMIEEKEKFVFVKRTETDIQLLLSGKGDADINPFMKLNEDYDWNIHPFRFGKGFGGFWHCEKDEKGENHPVGEMLGYILPLSTVAKVKGFNIDANYIVYDEFIPQIGERVNRGEGDSLWNLVETTERNRTILGKDPVTVICLANATLLYNPVFQSARLVNDVEKMIKRGKEVMILKDRGVYLHRLPDNDEFTKAKAETPLYRMMRGTRYERMALQNEFSYEDFGLIGFNDLRGYSPLFNISCDGVLIGVWQHKNGDVYLCNATDKHVDTYQVNEEQERLSCKIRFGRYYEKYLKSMVRFETFEIKQIYLYINK